MANHLSLRQQAVNAGAQDELDSTVFEVFAHGTAATFADRLVETQGGCLSETGGRWAGRFFTVPDVRVAMIFAQRACANTRHERPKIVGIALTLETVHSLRAKGLLTSPPIQNPPPGISPTTLQFVFERGALQELKRLAYFFPLM